MTVTVSNVIAPPGVTLLGNTVVEPSIDFNNAGQAEAFKTTAIAAGALTNLKLYLDASSTATKVVVGVYADSGGHPAALVSQATITTPLAGCLEHRHGALGDDRLRRELLDRGARAERVGGRALPRPRHDRGRSRDQQSDDAHDAPARRGRAPAPTRTVPCPRTEPPDML